MPERVWRTGDSPLHCWWECKLINHNGEGYGDSLKKKTGIKLLYNPANPLLGICPEETRIYNDMCTPVFIAAVFTIARTWQRSRCPLTNEWMRKLWCLYTMEYYSAVKRNVFESVLMR